MAVTTTEVTHTSAKKVIFAWTSDAAGAASGATSAAFDGKIEGLTTIPDGTNAPTAGYDVWVRDANSHDVLLGGGINRSATATESVASASLAAVAGSVLTLTVADAGNAKKGTVVVWVR